MLSAKPRRAFGVSYIGMPGLGTWSIDAHTTSSRDLLVRVCAWRSTPCRALPCPVRRGDLLAHEFQVFTDRAQLILRLVFQLDGHRAVEPRPGERGEEPRPVDHAFSERAGDRLPGAALLAPVEVLHGDRL